MAGPLRWSVVIVDGRRALVVSYEPFHRSGMAAVCPITSRDSKYPGEVPIPVGQAGQTLPGLVLVHQLRTIDLRRVTAYQVAGRAQTLSDAGIRRSIRRALAHHLGLDIPSAADGAA